MTTDTAKTEIVAPPNSHGLTIRRRFAASPELLLRAYTDPDLLVQWLGPRDLTMTIEELDPRHGGRYHYTHTTPDGEAHRFYGVFHGDPSVEAGLTQTFEWGGAPGNATLDKVTFEPDGDGTVVVTTSIAQSVETRDMMIESGMETGINEGYERLDELIARLAVTPTN